MHPINRVRPMTPKRAANIAAYAAISAEYRKLPKETRDRLLDDFRSEKANGGTVGWSRYIEVVIPRLPPEAR